VLVSPPPHPTPLNSATSSAENREQQAKTVAAGCRWRLSYNRLDLPADLGLTIFSYAAEPGSRSEEALKLLGSWAATLDLAEAAHSTDQS
jgi:hypothetical protein